MTKVNQRSILTYPSICLPVCLSTFLPIYLSTFLPFYLSTFVPFYLSTYLPFYLSTYLPFYLSTFLPIYLSTFLPFHPSIWINLSIFLWLSSNAIPKQSYMNDFPAQKKTFEHIWTKFELCLLWLLHGLTPSALSAPVAPIAKDLARSRCRLGWCRLRRSLPMSHLESGRWLTNVLHISTRFLVPSHRSMHHPTWTGQNLQRNLHGHFVVRIPPNFAGF